MNELPTSPKSDAPPGAVINPMPEHVNTGARNVESVPPESGFLHDMRKHLPLAVALLALIMVGQWWYFQSNIKDLREELARRLHNGDISIAESKGFAKAAQENAKELLVKVSVLENKQAESQSQQLALEQLYQDLSKNRDDWALAEIEQVLSTASQQLQLAGNVQGALIALQNADRSLSRSDRPQFINIRRAIAKDSEKLKSLPSLDLTGIALRLDSVISQIDTLPLLSDEKPSLPAIQPKKPQRFDRRSGRYHQIFRYAG